MIDYEEERGGEHNPFTTWSEFIETARFLSIRREWFHSVLVGFLGGNREYCIVVCTLPAYHASMYIPYRSLFALHLLTFIITCANAWIAAGGSRSFGFIDFADVKTAIKWMDENQVSLHTIANSVIDINDLFPYMILGRLFVDSSLAFMITWPTFSDCWVASGKVCCNKSSVTE